MGQVASKVSNVRLDNSGTMAALKAEAGIGNAILEGANKFHQAMVTADVMQANNEYNRQMNALQAKLYENKEGNARDNMAKYEEGRAKILDNVLKKGPSSMRDPMVRSAFLQTADKDWVNQQNRMRMYVMGEEEKNQDTQLNNGLQDCMSNIVTSYNNDTLLNDYVSKGDVLAQYRYANYGEERQKLEMNKWKGMAYGQAINAAIAGENFDRAGVLLQGYGKYLDPKTRISIDKIVSERKRSDIMLNDVNSYYGKYGKDVNAAWNEYSKTLGKNAGINVSNYAQSQIGQNLGTNTCAIFVGNAITAGGGDTSLISTLADGTYVNYEKKGLTFNDRSQLKDGDLVFWSVDGSGYEASNDKSAVSTGAHAYKGITHVGVYDAKSGKVIQSGTHGISAMDIDTAGYHFVGAAHQPGQALSPTEMEKRRKEFTQAYMVNVNRQNYQENLMVENFANQMLAMSRDGQPRSVKDYENLIYQFTGPNSDMYRKLQPLASHFGKGGGYHELSLIERVNLEDKIDNGAYTQDELLKELVALNVKPDKAMHYIEANKKARNKENKLDWNSLEKGFYAAIGGKDKTNEYDTMIIKDMAKQYIKYETEGLKHPQPAPYKIINYMTDVWGKNPETIAESGGYGEYRAVELYKAGFWKAQDSKMPGIVEVWERGSDEPKFVTKENFEAEMRRVK